MAQLKTSHDFISIDGLRRRLWRWAKEAAGLAWTVFLAFNRDRVMFAAGGVTFFTLVALFPTLGAVVALWGLWGDPERARAPLAFLAGAAPPDVLAYLGRQMHRLAARGGATLSFQFGSSLLLALWSADVGVKALVYALNIAYHTADTRNYVRYTLLTMTFTVCGLVFVLVTSALVVVATWLPASLPHGELKALRWPLLFIAYVTMLCPLYHYGPYRPSAHRGQALPGAVVAAVLNLAVSWVFAWYLSHVAQLDVTYGPLGATVGFLLWTWWSVIVILIGAELNGELEVRRNPAIAQLRVPAPAVAPAPPNHAARG